MFLKTTNPFYLSYPIEVSIKNLKIKTSPLSISPSRRPLLQDSSRGWRWHHPSRVGTETPVVSSCGSALLGTCRRSARQPRLENPTSAIFCSGPWVLFCVFPEPLPLSPIRPLPRPLVSVLHPPRRLKVRGEVTPSGRQSPDRSMHIYSRFGPKSFFKTYLQPLSTDLSPAAL